VTGPPIAVVGDGKMGRAVAQLAAERGWTVAALIGAEENRDGRALTRERLAGAEVVVEFTEPSAAPSNVRAAVDAGRPIVVGTTGWYGALPDVTRYVTERGGALLWSPNFSVGVNLFLRIVSCAAELMARGEFDAHLVETHHAAKKDAPSGTAQALVAAARSFAREVSVTSIRTGHVPGTHELLFDAPFEQIRLAHEARDRRVFADGALLAARWLLGRRGVFRMTDVLGLEG
jgi:4-hydroxy-tetrahydrodipicolinate reductase